MKKHISEIVIKGLQCPLTQLSMQHLEAGNRELVDFGLLSKSMKQNFFQSLEFHRVLQQVGWKTIFLKTQEPNSEASAMAYAPQEIPVYHRLFPHYHVFYGPCMKGIGENHDLTVLDSLLKELCLELRRNRCAFLSVAAPFPYPYAYDVFCQNGFSRVIVQGEYTVFVDLRENLDFLWKDMKRFARRSVKKALKKGVKIRDVESEVELKQFHRIYVSTATRRGFQSLPYRLFRTLWKLESKGLVKFFMASLGEKPIGGILNTFYANESVPYIACSLRRFWNYHPNHLLFWHSIRWSKEVAGSSVFKLYHLPSRNVKVQGVDYYTFKTCFGGRLIEERTVYHKIISPMKFRVLNVLKKSISQNSPIASPMHMIARNIACASN